MLAFVAVLVGSALIALAIGLAFVGILRTIAAGHPAVPQQPPTARTRSTVAPRRPTVRTRPTVLPRRPAPRPAGRDDYGLLRTVLLAENLDTARSVRDLLVAGGIRATIATGTDGRARVLVFPHEYAPARRLVSWVV
jgi:hypothetical protein